MDGTQCYILDTKDKGDNSTFLGYYKHTLRFSKHTLVGGENTSLECQHLHNVEGQQNVGRGASIFLSFHGTAGRLLWDGIVKVVLLIHFSGHKNIHATVQVYLL